MKIHVVGASSEGVHVYVSDTEINKYFQLQISWNIATIATIQNYRLQTVIYPKTSYFYL